MLRRVRKLVNKDSEEVEILANNEESLIKEIENDINDFYDISSNMVKMHIVFDFKSEELNNFEKI